MPSDNGTNDSRACSAKHCSRHRRGGNYCVYHTPLNSENRISSEGFFKRLKVLIRKEEGNWRGFIFPESIKLENFEIPIQIEATDAIFGEVHITQIKFLKALTVSNSTFSGNVLISSTEFDTYLAIQQSTFKGIVQLSSLIIKGNLIANNSHFYKDFRISGAIDGEANFRSSTFSESAQFTNTKHVSISVNTANMAISTSFGLATVSKERSTTETLLEWLRRSVKRIAINIWNGVKNKAQSLLVRAKKRSQKFANDLKNFSNQLRQRFPHIEKGTVRHRLFNGAAYFNGVLFEKPEKVKFKEVDLRLVYFSEVDLRKVSFIGNNWYQEAIGRNGLAEDVMLVKGKLNYYDRQEHLRLLETTYRSIRLSLEDVKDFAKANDFFIGEMKAKQNQLPWLNRNVFSLSRFYELLSNYGTSPLRCGLWFVVTGLIHSLILSLAFANHAPHDFDRLVINSLRFYRAPDLSRFSLLAQETSNFFVAYLNPEYILYSFQTLTLYKHRVELSFLESTSSLDFIFSVIGPILIGLFALTIRTKIKRN